MRDPREGLTKSGMIRTGADIGRVDPAFRPVHDAALALIGECDATATVHAYGSVVTGQASVGVSDVDLLTIGVRPDDANRIGTELSIRFADVCRGVEIGAARASDFVGETDEAYGNRVFLRHYCVLLAGRDTHRAPYDFPGDRRAARGFNGDIARHAVRWRTALDSDEEGGEEVGLVATRMGRKSLLAVAGLVSVHDHTWTTDRQTAADRWGEIVPEHRAGLAQLLAWTLVTPDAPAGTVRDVLDGTVESIVSAFSEQIGLWPDG